MSDPVWNVMLATCPSRTSLARVANKWTAMIVIVLSDGPARFGTIRDRVGGISAKVLSETLRDLERDGLLTRTAYDEMPPRVEYALSPLGATMAPPLKALGSWSLMHGKRVEEARGRFDARVASRARAA